MYVFNSTTYTELLRMSNQIHASLVTVQYRSKWSNPPTSSKIYKQLKLSLDLRFLHLSPKDRLHNHFKVTIFWRQLFCSSRICGCRTSRVVDKVGPCIYFDPHLFAFVDKTASGDSICTNYDFVTTHAFKEPKFLP